MLNNAANLSKSTPSMWVVACLFVVFNCVQSITIAHELTHSSLEQTEGCDLVCGMSSGKDLIGHEPPQLQIEPNVRGTAHNNLRLLVETALLRGQSRAPPRT